MGAFRRMGATAALLAMAAPPLQAQGEPELRGTVVSSDTHETVAGAWIALQGYEWGTYSWNDGHFFLPEIPERPARYDVRAIGYEPVVLTLDPGDSDLVVELTPVHEVLEGVSLFMEQLDRRRRRGGSVRVFDREALAFHGYFDLRDFLAQHRVRGVRRVCVDERPEAIGVLDGAGHDYYMAEMVGGYLRLYTDSFIERAARERLQLKRDPSVCSGLVDSATG